MQVKCFKCKEKSEKDTMICVEKGKEKITRRYFHTDCHEEMLHEQEMKSKEVKELDELYSYLLGLHSLDVLDGRMMEKIQDLRNGSIKAGGKKIKKYKQGISYSVMLETYKCLQQTIDNIITTMKLQTKWNEFSYVFGTMVNNINIVKEIEKKTNQVNAQSKTSTDVIEIQVKKAVKKDELDISSFL